MTDKRQDRLGPPPVEPLSDVAWARVERNLWERMADEVPTTSVVIKSPSSRRWVWVAIPTLAVAAAAVLIIGLRKPGLPDTDKQPQRIVSTTAPSAFTDGDVDMRLDAQTAVVLHHDSRSPSAVLERGAAWFTVAPRGERAPFVVVAGDTMVRVVGTKFRVARYEERAVIEVERGLVDVVFRGQARLVGADQRWTSDRPDEVVSTTHTARADEPAQTQAQPEEPIEIEPTVVTPGRPVRPTKRVKTPVAVKHDSTPEPAKPVDTAKSEDVAKPRATDPDQAKYDRLAGLEARDHKAAITGYLELSKGNGKLAELGLAAAARVALDRRDPRAETFLKIYLNRFPQGPHAADVRIQLARLKGETK